jgi:hypothetical protein
MEKKKPKVTKFDQKIIDAYEGFIIDVYEAVRFIKMASGKKHEGNYENLLAIINVEEKKMWRKISKVIKE